MKKHRNYYVAAIILILAGLSFLASIDKLGHSSPSELKLLILHTNDLHGHLEPFIDKAIAPPPEKVGGAAFIAGKIKEIRRKNPGATLLLDAGDISMGTPVSNEYRGKPVVEYMNLLRYDAMAIGNHEFDWGVPALQQVVKWAEFPVLSANIIESDSRKSPPFAKPYHIFQVMDTKIGVIGLTTPTTPRISNPEYMKKLVFLPPVDAVPRYMKILRDQGVDIIGILSHSGIDEDEKIARTVPGISFIVGGHDHIALFEPKNINGTIIVQARSYGMYLGALSLTIEKKTGKVLAYTAKDELIPIIDKNITPDKDVEQLIASYAEKIRPKMEEVVGYAREYLEKDPLPGRGDSPIGDIVTDILRHKTGTEVFFHNPGGLRAPLPEGKVTRGDVYRVLPFDDYIITMDLKGSEIMEILERGVKEKRMIQVSGLSLSFYKGKGGGGNITSVRMGADSLDMEKIYRVGTIDYLYTGGDGYETFKKGRSVHATKALSRDLLCEGIKENGALEVPGEKRIVITAGKK